MYMREGSYWEMSDQTNTTRLDARAPRTKRDYFALSREQALATRCPLLERCERRSLTIGLSRNWPGAPPAPQPKEPVVTAIEFPSYVGGAKNFFVQHLCPEVSLFEPEETLPGMSGYPTTSGQYDFYMSPKYEIIDTGHFSECPEFVAALEGIARSSISPETGREAVAGTPPKPVSVLGLMVAISTIAAAIIAVIVALYGDGLIKHPASSLSTTKISPAAVP
jgi:hypothetical protein